MGIVLANASVLAAGLVGTQQERHSAAMASNTSQGKIQSLILASKVQDYATWSLIVACGSCRSPRTISLSELPPELTIMQAMLRMRCQTCRGRVEGAVMDNNVPGWRAWIVKVWRPGSYG